MTEIFMPKAGMDMKEGRLIRWLKEVGDPVEKDEPVMEIETDKITMEAEAPGSGILLAKTVEEDTWVPVLSVIGYIGEPGEKIPEAPAASPKAPEPSQREEAPLPSVPGGSAEPAALAPPEKKSREAQTGPSAEREAAAVSGGQKQNPSAPSADSPILATPYAKKAARERGLDLKDIVPGRSDGVIRAADVLATPLARRIAQDQGVDLSAVAGTGCHGKVTKGDVLAAAQSSGAGFAAVQAVKADITCLLDLISQLNGSREKALSLDAFFLKAAALAVQKLSLSSGIYIVEHVVHAGIFTGLAVFHRVVDDGGGLLYRCIQLLLGEKPALCQVAPERLDGTFFLPGVDFLFGTVQVAVALGVAGNAVGVFYHHHGAVFQHVFPCL